ncbi:peptidase S1 [Brevundimonas staleyi]|uniref:Peptidase S1 n=1 Tax=Brevundimonas staleyi TaxID=74326 RepID=A0ABW0FX53_9CAUL
MKTTVSMRLGAAVAACTMLAGGPALAQDASLDPNFGSVSLRAGFTPDPMVVRIAAGGNINVNDASSLGGQCVGMITDAPDYRIHYTAQPGVRLTIRIRSQADTTLVVNGPDGQWYCNDDIGSSINPGVLYRTPRSGVYDIWVGTYGSDPAPAEIRITEME